MHKKIPDQYYIFQEIHRPHCLKFIDTASLIKRDLFSDIAF